MYNKYGVLKLIGETKQRIIHLLMPGPSSAEQISKALEINVSAARKHLEELALAGLVSSKFIKAGVGRPRKVFFLTEKAQEELSDFANTLLSRIVSKLRESEPDRAEGYMSEVASEMSASIKSESLREKFLDLGFYVDTSDDKIMTYTCPLLSIAKENTQLICSVFHGKLLEGALGRKAELVQTMASGASFCVHKLR